MKKLLYTVALVVMGITASYAQNDNRRAPQGTNETPEQRAEKHATKLQADLSLTADQKAKVKAIELERIKKNDEWRKKDDTDRKSKMDERQSFMKASKDKMDAILTADQKAKFEASRKNRRDGERGERGDRNGKGPRGSKGPRGENTPPPPPANN